MFSDYWLGIRGTTFDNEAMSGVKFHLLLKKKKSLIFLSLSIQWLCLGTFGTLHTALAIAISSIDITIIY